MGEVTRLLARHYPVASPEPGCRSPREPAPTHRALASKVRTQLASFARPARVPCSCAASS
eukprot:3197102-Prymnesium_polylepis.1